MRNRLWWLCLAFILAAGMCGVAVADVSWSGPGWYVEASTTGFDVELISGPYADKASCEPHVPTDDDASYSCDYESSDPTGGGS